jgi:hypothetical protein
MLCCIAASAAAAAAAGLSFEVLSLERQVQGSNLPLPKTLIKSLLNVVMPSVSAPQYLCSSARRCNGV